LIETVVNLVEPNSLFLDTQRRLCAPEKRFGSSGTASFGSNPATNAWFTLLTIMDGRYIRFGAQMSFEFASPTQPDEAISMRSTPRGGRGR
jgi:hypothetical protein